MVAIILVNWRVTMVGPRRPQFVLFGSSIVQLSFGQEGWGATLADIYTRKDDAVQPSLVIVYFGGNDSVLPHPDNQSSHVPLSEYVENMRKIYTHLKSLSETTRVIFLTAPPMNEAQLLQVLGEDSRTNELCQKYADACEELCQEIGIEVINLCNAFKRHDNWMTTCFTDGIHLTPIGSKIVAKEILKVLKEAEWKPSLCWEDLAMEFA
ncbi:hypothetical protein M8C21_019969 [Ambrosia artemisiifolia]|uniref:SGNH hydrolase-type esterase domain-containing protein n=1 Tax=Ambrosia artemisiifolia TaxID=4212 RepID=A0AAD5G7C1_AMBAR|nr:hypothetical protein M8C21_019969 [Ambrosia artemisiifolia]